MHVPSKPSDVQKISETIANIFKNFLQQTGSLSGLPAGISRFQKKSLLFWHRSCTLEEKVLSIVECWCNAPIKFTVNKFTILAIPDFLNKGLVTFHYIARKPHPANFYEFLSYELSQFIINCKLLFITLQLWKLQTLDYEQTAIFQVYWETYFWQLSNIGLFAFHRLCSSHTSHCL